MTAQIKIFYSYAHDDERLRKKLEKQLTALQQQSLIADWHDRMISAGTEWEHEIDAHLNEAEIILLLISTSFLASKYCYSIEMKRALERYEAGETRIIPIILRPAYWQEAPFAKLQALPTNGKPVTSWRDQEEAFLNVAQGIQKAIEEITKKTAPAQSKITNNKATVQPLHPRKFGTFPLIAIHSSQAVRTFSIVYIIYLLQIIQWYGNDH